MEILIPKHKIRAILCTGEADDHRTYCCFPSIQRFGDKVLIAYRRAVSNIDDGVIDIAIKDLNNNEVSVLPVIGIKNLNLQNPEIVPMPDDSLFMYIDTDDPSYIRRGMITLRSTDGYSWQNLERKLIDTDGLEYGYVFDSIRKDSTVWIIAMTFSELNNNTLGRCVFILRSDDCGETWSKVQNLTVLFQARINECAFATIPEGYCIASRGDDSITRLAVTDEQFESIRQIQYQLDGIVGSSGRPSLFTNDGALYMIMRSVQKYTDGRYDPMTLRMYQIDQETLQPVSCILLEEANTYDGFYAEGYQTFNGIFHVVTYSACDSKPPDIIELTYN